MNAMFGSLTSDGLQEAEDRLGGFQVLETDIYTGPVKVAYAGQSQKGARSVTLIVEVGGREHRETVYITNQKGENFFYVKGKDGKPTDKKAPLPGFTMIDDLCLVATGAPLSEQEVEEKMVNVWDPDQRKELPKSVPVLVGLTGQTVTVAIEKHLVDKTKKEGDEYVPTGETRHENVIVKVFDPETKLTVVEAKAGQAASFHDAWLEKNKGQVKDKTSKDTQSGQSGRPGQSAGAPQAAGNGGAPRKSLFGNKAA